MKTLIMKRVKRFYVIYFSGFSIKNEVDLFTKYIDDGEYCVSGFSFGAQKAFEYVYNSDERIEKLILLSPSFFQDKKSSFVRTQLKHFVSEKETYIKQFLLNVAYPSTINLEKYLSIGTKEELEALLRYEWKEHKIKALLDRGVHIEVFLGAKDKIIDAQAALSFFSTLTTSYYFKDAGHLLQNT